MTNYEQLERGFIERTLKIIDQYEEIVRPHVGYQYEYEVTLLMNCLLGLLIYPQQIASQRGFQQRFDRWLTNERVVEVGKDWGIVPQFIESPGSKRLRDGSWETITLERFTIRELVRQLRNAAAHASFNVNDANGQITAIEFRSQERENDFAMQIPAERLERFVRKLAESALERLPG